MAKLEFRTHDAGAPRLPDPRGPLSQVVVDALREAPRQLVTPRLSGEDFIGDDAQLALHCCYELHYRSFAGVHAGWEWAPELLGLRRDLERVFVERLFDEVGPIRSMSPARATAAVRELATRNDGPSLSTFMLECGTLAQMQEFCVHRSAYQLKEADPHTWMIPRLQGRAKAAAVTIQHDEYGQGTSAAMHSSLFADTMRHLGLDATYGAYVDLLPGTTLATGNLVSLFGLHRRWRAACIGHLALFEMTSVGPMARYAATLERLGVDEAARRFYEAHVTADAWHERIAQTDLVGGFLQDDSSAAGTVLFGAAALAAVEGRMTRALLAAWRDDRTSLRAALPNASDEGLQRSGNGRVIRIPPIGVPQEFFAVAMSSRLGAGRTA